MNTNGHSCPSANGNGHFQKPKRKLFRFVLSLILATIAAYAFSFAVDLLIGGLIGIYPTTAFLPVVTWSFVSGISILAASALIRFNRWLVLPYLLFGALAVLGGCVGLHPHNFAVAAAMFLHAFFVWIGAKPPQAKVKRWDEVLNKCDFAMARDEIADMHKMLNKQGSKEGGEYIFKNEYVAALQSFRDNPNKETARALLKEAPHLLDYFNMCSPDHSFYSTSRYLKE
jgi:hypothetical protein